MLDRSEFARWRSEASRAMRSAELQAAADLHNWACFAAEQATQLALKGLLHGVGAGAWGHDLERLGVAVAEALADAWPAHDLTPTLLRLGRHYIPARYPDAHAEGPPGDKYTAEDARSAIEDAQRILDAVDASWDALVAADDDAG